MNPHAFRDQVGLEISGPSDIFREGSLLGIYPSARRVDDFSFPRPMGWGGRRLIPGFTFSFDPAKEPGWQFVGDSVNMPSITSESYDFVIASHVFEHIANPLKAAREWIRILKPSGRLLLVVPHREGTFDRTRPVTPLEHICHDLANDTREDDSTHFDEVAHLSDKSFPQDWFPENVWHRGMHHHVFNTRAMVTIYDHLRLKIEYVGAFLPYHVVISGIKPERGSDPDNTYFLGARAPFRQESPFLEDRLDPDRTPLDSEHIGSGSSPARPEFAANV